jgi:hypothetical protein
MGIAHLRVQGDRLVHLRFHLGDVNVGAPPAQSMVAAFNLFTADPGSCRGRIIPKAVVIE